MIPESETIRIGPLDRVKTPAFPMRGLRSSDIWHMTGRNGIKKRRTREFALWARAHGAGAALRGQPGHSTNRVTSKLNVHYMLPVDEHPSLNRPMD